MNAPKHRLTVLAGVAAFLLEGCACISGVQPATTTGFLPVRVSADGRHLIGAAGKPLLLHGDTAWSLLLQLTAAEAGEYLENHRRKGVNSIIATNRAWRVAPPAWSTCSRVVFANFSTPKPHHRPSPP